MLSVASTLRPIRSRPLSALRCVAQRLASGGCLKDILKKKICDEQKKVLKFRKEKGSHKLGDVTVGHIYGGMRGMYGLVYETSTVDPEKGIFFRDYSIPECQKCLPKFCPGGEMQPEGVLWLLLTGDIPKPEDVKMLTSELRERGKLPDSIVKFIKDIPQCTHPMAQLSATITVMNAQSEFVKHFNKGIKKDQYWEYYYEDALNLIARITTVAAMIYRNTYHGGKGEYKQNPDLDWTGNFAKMLGFDDNQFAEMMRLYLSIHVDHEGGNVSAHAVHLVASALSDPYLSFAAGMNGLAGPLHGLANQEVLIWMQQLQKEVGKTPKEEQIKEFVLKTLKSGRVIPGFGHAVLRVTDPRYISQQQFAQKNLKDDELVKLTALLFKVVPKVLGDLGKVKNPWPNVDAHSGVLLMHYGLKEMQYYTVLFGVSRSLGCMSAIVWDRALGYPIERPKSITTKNLMALVECGGK